MTNIDTNLNDSPIRRHIIEFDTDEDTFLCIKRKKDKSGPLEYWINGDSYKELAEIMSYLCTQSVSINNLVKVLVSVEASKGKNN